MSRYIAVIHGWHVSSNGFDVHELSATDKEEAHNEAVLLKHQRESTFDKCAFTVIEITDHERLPRKLTFRERLAGRTNP
ncbi:hypothetical protein [Enterobacter hormaechei]|uniref:hypothetical protein n=1 Tax=Enterobacter hormaechei TaxID=158836 RepID=UPI000757EDD6|nr:hypothetical protein [Enterobacter hormaechei]RYH36180.1 hypothetical protein EVY09_19330 [Enterobacter cloacae]HAS0868546.1 hypothetical protein [Enterobacter hormaechei subsp. oharae]EKW5527619.1 hypothetical protein [Enterobacter hormaechei]ELC6402363.1 hypothetical protein [Enterobacter hormaechei]KVK22138.1 hypothetical protein AWS17_16985 [Enterobacter hormaechei subsp. steigerwaltii]